mmetsp:Transcript_21868/g.55963  ORF Transcript_21868/g.55963 Transcript_21868/m.55963 type:complete len:237 (+) Transcript_21868:203-913(+)
MHLEVLVVVADRHILRLLQLPLVLRDERGVDLDLRGLRELTNELQVTLVRETPGKPQEWLLEVVVAPGTEVVVLQVALPVELNVLRLNLPVLDIDLVAHEHDWNVLAHPHNVSVPIRNVLVGDARRHIEHNDGTLTLDVVAITQAAELFLARGVPNVEGQRAAIRSELEGMDLDAQGGDVLLLELPRQVALHERGLAYASIAHQHQLELGARHRRREGVRSTATGTTVEWASRLEA